MKRIILFAVMVYGATTFAEKVPPEVVNQLYSLTNLWGKTDGLHEYWTARNKIETQLRKYDDWKDVHYTWHISFIDFISKVPSFSYGWLNEGSTEMMLVSRTSKIQLSTNCWLNAADCLHRIITKRDEAYEKWQVADKKLSNDFSMGGDSEKEWRAARNRYVNINNSIGTLAWSVTNSFPSAILPTFSEAEGAALYTNVLRRAGLVQ